MSKRNSTIEIKDGKVVFSTEVLEYFESIRNKENSGPGVCRNVGLNHSSNPYIFFIDSDDTLINYRSLENLFNREYDQNSESIISIKILVQLYLEVLSKMQLPLNQKN